MKTVILCGGQGTRIRDVADSNTTDARFAQCSDTVLREELVSSEVYLKGLLTQPVITLSYPHNAVDWRGAGCSASRWVCFGDDQFLWGDWR